MDNPGRIVLHVVSELYPIIKTGGLADVAAALPEAQRRIGCDARLILPGYPRVLAATSRSERIWYDTQLFGGGPAELMAVELHGCETPAYVLDCPGHFSREGGPYGDSSGEDWPDNHRRFAALGWASAVLLGLLGEGTILHAHDWQAGLAVAYAKLRLTEPHPCVTTIHNIEYPGAFPSSVFHELGLPPSSFGVHGVEFYGRVSFLKAGLFYADEITAVSPTYSKEIQSSGQGGGFEGLLRGRREHITGILNGVDYTHWDPATDRHIPCHFDAERLEDKQRAKKALCDRLGLSDAPGRLLIGVVSRLVSQKGIDWLLESVPWLVSHGASLVVIGTGDRVIETGLQIMMDRYPGRVSVFLGYSEALAHWIQAGSDCIAIPSRAEPCGLTQMYALRYGSLPIVRRTGGLSDTVVDATRRSIADGTGTGFLFDEESAEGLQSALARAIALHSDPPTWRKVQTNAMAQNFAWERSARQYVELYSRLESAART